MICPFCDSKYLKIKRKLISPVNKTKYTQWRCLSCDLEFFTPLKFEDVYESEINEHYAGFHKGRTEAPEWILEVAKSLKRKGLSLKNKKILDVGAGDGINFLVLKKYFKVSSDDYYALELDKKSLAVCKRRGIKNTINVHFDKSFKSDFKFDYVFATEVFEHQTNPKEFLDKAFELLKSEGVLILTVPYRHASFMRFKEIPGDIPPHHFLRFSLSFFRRNFNNLILLKTWTSKRKNLKSSAELTSKILLKSKKVYFLFFIPVLLLRVYDYFNGEGIIVLFRKSSKKL